MYRKDFVDIARSILPQSGYIDYQEGMSNILISAPHGGGIKPLGIPSRKQGTLVRDSYTRRLAYSISNLLELPPYYCIADIHRSRVDLNRPIEEGAGGNYRASNIWLEWNDILHNYTGDIISNSKTGLFIDIHSHNNSHEFQLGYNIPTKEYLELETSKKLRVSSTISSLRRQSLHEMLYGECSISNSLKERGYSVYRPKKNEQYFNGGYNVENFSGKGIGAIQIEVPVVMLGRDLDRVARALAYSIELFVQRFV